MEGAARVRLLPLHVSTSRTKRATSNTHSCPDSASNAVPSLKASTTSPVATSTSSERGFSTVGSSFVSAWIELRMRWTEMPAGGHFAALEEPERLVEDVRAFFRELR